MKISVLTDNHAGSFTLAEHGLSYLIEYDEKRILFDTGQSDVFTRNARRMNVNIGNIDLIILSHGHFDHGNGLDHITGNLLICHPGCFVKRYGKKDRRYIGLKNPMDELAGKFRLHTTTKPHAITEKIMFLGEIPRNTVFESQNTSFILEDGTPDYVPDDSALALLLPEGLFIITGCGHAGIVNIIEHAKKVTGIQKLAGIIGGLHLKGRDVQTNETISYLKKEEARYVLPSHCTELPALSAFYDAFGMKQIKTGDVLTFNQASFSEQLTTG
jgi:7,8-dihydropterin-6-yl-methyl-4-(beta-D-ribofuranosyl)aminobenzene 5'-phosphate synthase